MINSIFENYQSMKGLYKQFNTNPISTKHNSIMGIKILNSDLIKKGLDTVPSLIVTDILSELVQKGKVVQIHSEISYSRVIATVETKKETYNIIFDEKVILFSSMEKGMRSIPTSIYSPKGNRRENDAQHQRIRKAMKKFLADYMR